jgi:hypothetical protein
MADAFGLRVNDLPDGCTPLEVVGAVKVLNDEGNLELWGFQSENITFWEAAGMLRVSLAEYETNITMYHFDVPDDEDEEDDD